MYTELKDRLDDLARDSLLDTQLTWPSRLCLNL
jgi:hypothetical protein